jgi:hypothetical protein
MKRQMTRSQKFEEMYGHVGGFMMARDMACFDFFLTWQNNIGLVGDYFEIGVLNGKSTFFASQFIKPGESVGLIDINDISHVAQELRRRDINVNYYTGKSSAARCLDVFTKSAGKIRFFHIDGDHSGFSTYSDLQLAADALCEKGIIALDDFFNRNYPQLVAAAYKFLAERIDYKLLLVGDNKAYIVRSEDYDYYYSIKMGLFEYLIDYGQPTTLRKSAYAHDMGALVMIAREGDKDFIGRDEDPDQLPY